jgi:hypothetical protein
MGLTTEDKEWIKGQLDANRLELTSRIKANRLELKTEIGSVRSDLTSRMEGIHLQVTSDIGAVRSQITSESVATRLELQSRIDGLRREFDEKLERVETKLLTEFHKWTSPTELRLSAHATAMRAIDLEPENVKERLRNLEPPPGPH